ncbi:hypothetical protein NIES4102_22130 [Chondrocystis sp. NIES-4102]|nr:hypothetical protein NIES4102_22130 [Chondrocystis sp. NIES-4102]
MISKKSTILSKSVGLALIGAINSFSTSSAFSQQTGCSNYWVNPNTGKTECFGINADGNFRVIPENSGSSSYDDPFQKAKESLDESCLSIWLKISHNLKYGSYKYNRLEESYEQCNVAQSKLRDTQWEQERKEINARQERLEQKWEKEREETNPKGFCISPQSNSSITDLLYSTCNLLTITLGRANTQKIFDTSTPASNDKVNNLKQLCEEGGIRPSLKSPSTAVFSSSSTIKVTNGIYYVTGNVDAQNSYGAMLRNRYACILNHSSDRFNLVYHYLND